METRNPYFRDKYLRYEDFDTRYTALTLTHLQENNSALQTMLNGKRKECDEKTAQITELTKEVARMQDLVTRHTAVCDKMLDMMTREQLVELAKSLGVK